MPQHRDETKSCKRSENFLMKFEFSHETSFSTRSLSLCKYERKCMPREQIILLYFFSILLCSSRVEEEIGKSAQWIFFFIFSFQLCAFLFSLKCTRAFFIRNINHQPKIEAFAWWCCLVFYYKEKQDEWGLTRELGSLMFSF